MYVYKPVFWMILIGQQYFIKQAYIGFGVAVTRFTPPFEAIWLVGFGAIWLADFEAIWPAGFKVILPTGLEAI